MKLFYEIVERYDTNEKVWSGIKTFLTIQNSYPVICTNDKLNKRKAAKIMSTFDFSTLYTEIPHEKLLYALNEITDFAFKGGTRDYFTVYNSRAFWSRSKSNIGRFSSLLEIKSCLEFLIKNSFFQVSSKFFHQVIGIHIFIWGHISRHFLPIFFCSFYKSKWLKSIKNTVGSLIKLDNNSRFIDDLITINDGNKFENHSNEIYPTELILKRENYSHSENSFLDPHIYRIEGQIQTLIK